MKNYVSKFEFKPGKVAFIQEPAYRTSAQTYLDKARTCWMPPSHYYHFRRGGHVAALKRHSGNQVFACLDISNFFPSVTKNKLTRALKRIGFSFREAEEFAGESTVWIDDKLVLPHGFIQSPFLATLALDKSALGKAFRSARKAGVDLTVYMDDIIISHPTSEQIVGEVLEQLLMAASEAGFSFNPDKSEGPANTIAAFNIALSHGQIELTPEKYDAFYGRIMKHGYTAGTIATVGYAKTVNDVQAVGLVDRLDVARAALPCGS